MLLRFSYGYTCHYISSEHKKDFSVVYICLEKSRFLSPLLGNSHISNSLKLQSQMATRWTLKLWHLTLFGCLTGAISQVQCFY